MQFNSRNKSCMISNDKPTLENENFGPLNSRRVEFKHTFERGGLDVKKETLNARPWYEELREVTRWGAAVTVQAWVRGRGLHSSTFQLNVSAFCGIGCAFRGCVRGVQGVSMRCSGVLGVV
jgi:hypothetical protein